MKFFTKLGLYKASNVTFNPKTLEANSYGWWSFVRVINGQVVFNDYRYSSSTQRHQRKVRNLMEALGIKIDIFVESPEGLQNIQSAINYYDSKIKILLDEIDQPNSRNFKNVERLKEIGYLEARKQIINILLDKRNNLCFAG